LRVTLWGARGSIPTPTPANAGYGGNTCCAEVRTADGTLVILDGGMGLHWLGRELIQDGFGEGQGEAHVLLSHTHWGHIQGIPFFTPLLVQGNHFALYGPKGSAPLQELMQEQLRPTYCPVPNFFNERIGAAIEIRELEEGAFQIGSARIVARRVNHAPGVACFAYRLEEGPAVLAYLPDVEYLSKAQRKPALELARGADLLLHDAHYTAAEYPRHRGQGHACDRDAVSLAQEAGVGCLVLFHHHPDHDDACIDAMVAAHQGHGFPVEGGREGRTYTLGE